MQNKQFRRFLCLLFTFVILISCVITPAYAIDPVIFAGCSVAASIVVASIINGVGVFPVDSESGAFGTLVNNCVSALEAATNFIIDGQIFVTGVPNATGYKSYVPLNLVQFVWEWLFDSGAVSQSSPVTSQYVEIGPYPNATYTLTSQGNVPFETLVIWRTGSSNYDGYDVFAYCPASASNALIVYKDGSTYPYGSSVYGEYHVAIVAGSSGSVFATIAPVTNLRVVHLDTGLQTAAAAASAYFGSASVNPSGPYSENFALGNIETPYDGSDAPLLLPNAPVYAPWTEQMYSIPSYAGSNEFVDGLPVSIPGSVSSSMTQSGAQAGTNELEDWVVTEPVPATLTDILNAVISLPSSIVGSISTALSNFFSISGTASDYGIQLKDFFPFCIPFDIYDFLTVLAADPVAPVIEWEIPVPWLGQTYPISVDLADWEPIAVLFRTFELLGFIIGLAIITRKNFLRS